jgi:thiazole synthase ThiGH ThiG subunit
MLGAAVMPLGSPIGNKGLKTIDFLRNYYRTSKVPVIIDAGLVHLQMLQNME